MSNLDFTHEATTIIRFSSDRQFAEFRTEVEKRYDSRMVRVSRYQVRKGVTHAIVSHASNLGAELKGLAYGHFDGHSLPTIDKSV